MQSGITAMTVTSLFRMRIVLEKGHQLTDDPENKEVDVIYRSSYLYFRTVR